jgi:hypothetical protein
VAGAAAIPGKLDAGERGAAVLCRTPLMIAAVPAGGTVEAGDRRDHQEV